MDRTETSAPRRRTVSRVATVAAAALAMVTLLLPATSASAGAEEDGFAAKVNAERASAGLPGLRHVVDLQEVARRHSQKMAAESNLHHNPNLGSDVANWSRLSENVGYGGSVDIIHTALMNSAGHRANILDSGVSQMGIGIAWSGTRLWVTQVFRAPTGAAVSAPDASAPAPAPAPAPATLPSVCDGAPGSPFTDVPRSAWYVGAVDCAVSKDLAKGVSPTSYAPERGVTRAQMASFLNRVLLRSDEGATATSGPDVFADDNGSPHETAINTLANLGVLNGTGAHSYSPHAQVSRAQMASMLVRLQEKIAGPMQAADAPFVDIAASPHAASIQKVFAAGITTGTSATTYTPDAGVRRDGMAVFLVRSFGGMADAGAVH